MRPNALRFLGHATVVIDLDGVRLLTDPLLRPRIAGLVHRHPQDNMSLVEGTRAVLISHLHHDHLDIPSLRRLERDAVLLAPSGAGPMLKRRGLTNSVELSPADIYPIDAIRIVATQARHLGYRVPFGPRGGCLGFVLEGTSRIYFAGDTAFFSGLDALGPIDVALLPVAGWGPILGPGHMGPRQAVRALQHIRPRVVVPIHWGSLVPIGLHFRSWSYLTRPPHEFAELARREIPEVDVQVLEPGEALAL